MPNRSRSAPGRAGASIGFRPETLTILFDGQTATDRESRAEVVEVVYYGDMTYYDIRLEGTDRADAAVDAQRVRAARAGYRHANAGGMVAGGAGAVPLMLTPDRLADLPPTLFFHARAKLAQALEKRHFKLLTAFADHARAQGWRVEVLDAAAGPARDCRGFSAAFACVHGRSPVLCAQHFPLCSQLFARLLVLSIRSARATIQLGKAGAV